VDAEKDIDTLAGEIATLTKNLDKTNVGSGRIAFVKGVIKKVNPSKRFTCLTGTKVQILTLTRLPVPA
jgi:hypothetical protein